MTPRQQGLRIFKWKTDNRRPVNGKNGRLSVVGCQFSIGTVCPGVSWRIAMARILVVDDEPDAVELLQEFLTAKGYDVITASDGEEALRQVKEHRPHLILLDVRMPKLNGMEVLKRVREIDEKIVAEVIKDTVGVV